MVTPISSPPQGDGQQDLDSPLPHIQGDIIEVPPMPVGASVAAAESPQADPFLAAFADAQPMSIRIHHDEGPHQSLRPTNSSTRRTPTKPTSSCYHCTGQPQIKPCQNMDRRRTERSTSICKELLWSKYSLGKDESFIYR
jgi:hypothetical protein